MSHRQMLYVVLHNGSCDSLCFNGCSEIQNVQLQDRNKHSFYLNGLDLSSIIFEKIAKLSL